jgi:hypothetical protein
VEQQVVAARPLLSAWQPPPISAVEPRLDLVRRSSLRAALVARLVEEELVGPALLRLEE